ncbi:hypothetical protein PHAVU_006G093000 [Phaseolus vulgaris]|uniref:Uncharacterized protein n=1 Tax=Phaseolus vulgaris TaxID=3885 RepID=V7BPT5_PHAVU|nr:hypothetical protein PHAVU_006G093000g [Phaseolus vulgaris]ESW19055.1 hypothetical protein PHAVU_006G093000g [Phaseolus vulgaris]
MANVTECSSKSGPRTNDVWPCKMKLTTDCMRWDSLKISPKEFEESMLGHMNESSRKALESWIPVNISIYDVDNGETYDTKLFKKESFWFDPMPISGEKPMKGKSMMEPLCYNLEKAREEFAYSIEPFRHIVRKRDLRYDQEIGLRYCGGNVVVAFEFSVLHSPPLDVRSLRP